VIDDPPEKLSARRGAVWRSLGRSRNQRKTLFCMFGPFYQRELEIHHRENP
jgi:hypothetical protein